MTSEGNKDTRGEVKVLDFMEIPSSQQQETKIVNKSTWGGRKGEKKVWCADWGLKEKRKQLGRKATAPNQGGSSFSPGLVRPHIKQELHIRQVRAREMGSGTSKLRGRRGV